MSHLEMLGQRRLPERLTMASAHANIHRLRPRLRLVIDNADREISLDESKRRVCEANPIIHLAGV
jgi:hypothetical protein